MDILDRASALEEKISELAGKSEALSKKTVLALVPGLSAVLPELFSAVNDLVELQVEMAREIQDLKDWRFKGGGDGS